MTSGGAWAGIRKHFTPRYTTEVEVPATRRGCLARTSRARGAVATLAAVARARDTETDMQIDAEPGTVEAPSKSPRRPAPRAPEFPGCHPVPLVREDLHANSGTIAHGKATETDTAATPEPRLARQPTPDRASAAARRLGNVSASASPTAPNAASPVNA